MSEELRPCPFCGGTKICTEKGINLNYCDNCSAESNIEHWNTRPIEDELRSRIAELEAERRWIPVSERLPEYKHPYEYYLVCDTSDSSMQVAERNDYHKDWTFQADLWCSEHVTHWMPLPTPPEVQE